MQPASQQDRPPYVMFETRGEEDRQASIEAGNYVAKNVDYAIITPAGSKDRIERHVQDWFEMLSQSVVEGRFPAEWLQHFKASFTAWKEGQAMPEHGTPIVNWPAASPAQIKTLTTLHVKTLEDLAAANEETLGRIGMGGRALKQKAIEWLEGARGTGRQAEEITALKIRNSELEDTVKSQATQLAELKTQVSQLATQKL